MKKTLFLFSILSIFFYACKNNGKDAAPSTLIETEDAQQDEILVQTIKIGNDSAAYRFLASYPETTSYPFINEYEYNFVHDFETEFKRLTNENKSADSLIVHPAPIDFNQHFEVLQNNDNVIVFLIEREASYGNNSTKQFFTHYYDLNKKKKLRIENVFNNINDFRAFAEEAKQIVSDTIKNKIFNNKEIPNADKEKMFERLLPSIAEGTEASGENYKTMILLPNGDWKFIFDKYSVAPGYMGEISIELPKAKMDTYLKPSFLNLVNNQPVQEEEEDEILPQQPEEVAVDCSKVPCVALTFDDGPSDYTPQLLDILKENNVKATFFVLGKSAQVQQKTIQRAYSEGHEIESHTWDHKDLKKLSAAKVQEEVDRTDDVLEELIGKRSDYLRPPYGSISPTVKKVVKKPFILWNIDPEDWRIKNSKIVAERLSKAEPNAILLAHDIHKTTVEAIPEVIKNLKAKGYHFVTVAQLLADQNLQNGHAYRFRKPIKGENNISTQNQSLN
ncbi:polysaccharide deacetylase family protein [Ornithobacterium rhinotracheale]|nr:polysaccharide deacetylase family protein [Ornithobacterium rhinotracheale]AIP99946.1 hypothetical protein Q785_10235 [Ornithobacterium rhinotracheale ORT-UMN 88]KGB66372.1 hypothetical protein Q787_10070 [Ornithobacterium rhinotracheale H06-030791]MCK0193498.1 polysaccharide deacetylase family protein [Ornithobacterium rhinotracheale]MCK0206119.1 polysaccharide deacetylase family protein [Ornithobacterium rhinotracheale]UOH63557.1 polysaccharide deacetylase family protein [Ornithobacterium